MPLLFFSPTSISLLYQKLTTFMKEKKKKIKEKATFRPWIHELSTCFYCFRLGMPLVLHELHLQYFQILVYLIYTSKTWTKFNLKAIYYHQYTRKQHYCQKLNSFTSPNQTFFTLILGSPMEIIEERESFTGKYFYSIYENSCLGHKTV